MLSRKRKRQKAYRRRKFKQQQLKLQEEKKQQQQQQQQQQNEQHISCKEKNQKGILAMNPQQKLNWQPEMIKWQILK